MDSVIQDGFRKVCQSLKLARRAELVDQDSNEALIDSLYVDPLPGDGVLKSALDPHTTFFVGRKGCGKSTIFQKLQSEIQKKGGQTSAYIDIKTVFESCQIDTATSLKLSAAQAALPKEACEQILLKKAFLESLVAEVRVQLQRKFTGSVWARLKGLFGSQSELDAQLEDLVASLEIPTFENVLALYQPAVNRGSESKQTDSADVGLGISPAGGSVKIDLGTEAQSSETQSVAYSDVFLRFLNVKNFIARLREFLARAGYSRLYILIDDFSELPAENMRFVVDVLLAPLNNWSDELVKFKIAAYPGRVYFGEIDKTKVDEVYLDLFKMYGNRDVSSMEDSAIRFTRRLIEVRFERFLKGRLSDVFVTDDDGVWRNLFYASMANPRVLGYVLHFCSDLALSAGKKISVSIIQDAAEKYYEEKVEEYFRLGRFLHETFAERLSIYSLKELLEDVVKRSKDLRQHSSGVFDAVEGNPHTSHFHVTPEMEQILRTLELNFFVTKYFEMTDRSGRKVSVFALNYGLCKKYSIRFGRPTGKREFRLYFVERVFDYSTIVLSFLNRNQEIVCNNCDAQFSVEQLDALKLFQMRCPHCGQVSVSVVNLSRKYEKDLSAISDELLLDKIELGILAVLNSEGEDMRPGDVAMELDCSHQLVGRRAKSLFERRLIDRPYQGNQRLYTLLDLARRAYFSDSPHDDLDVQAEPLQEQNHE